MECGGNTVKFRVPGWPNSTSATCSRLEIGNQLHQGSQQLKRSWTSVFSCKIGLVLKTEIIFFFFKHLVAWGKQAYGTKTCLLPVVTTVTFFSPSNSTPRGRHTVYWWMNGRMKVFLIPAPKSVPQPSEPGTSCERLYFHSTRGLEYMVYKAVLQK